MKPWLLLVTALCTSCVADRGRPAPESRELEIRIARDLHDQRPVAVVTITNRSAGPVCLKTETLRNPYGYEMDVRLRDAVGVTFRFQDPGFIPPPLAGVVRLESGRSETGFYYLDSRFKLPGQGTSLPPGVTARASFPYGYCDEALSRRATSAWQAI